MRTINRDGLSYEDKEKIFKWLISQYNWHKSKNESKWHKSQTKWYLNQTKYVFNFSDLTKRTFIKYHDEILKSLINSNNTLLLKLKVNRNA